MILANSKSRQQAKNDDINDCFIIAQYLLKIS